MTPGPLDQMESEWAEFSRLTEVTFKQRVHLLGIIPDESLQALGPLDGVLKLLGPVGLLLFQLGILPLHGFGCGKLPLDGLGFFPCCLLGVNKCLILVLQRFLQCI